MAHSMRSQADPCPYTLHLTPTVNSQLMSHNIDAMFNPWEIYHSGYQAHLLIERFLKICENLHVLICYIQVSLECDKGALWRGSDQPEHPLDISFPLPVKAVD